MRKINTLQSLRFFAFMMIFLLHTQTYNFTNFFYGASCGVSFFIMLSGFLYGYKYCDYKNNIKIKDVINFALKKIKGFYPIHLITLFTTIPLTGIFTYICVSDINKIISCIKNIIINALLLQCYTKEYFLFNGVSWYLSLTVFLTIITLPLVKVISKIGNSSKGTSKLFTCLLFILLIDFVYILYIKNNSLSIEYWLYIFPPSRITEYIFGITTGFIINKKRNLIEKKCNTLIITLLEMFTILSLLIIFKYIFVGEWLWRTIIWVIPNTFLIAVFSLEKGKVSNLISNKLFVWLGNITLEAFLIHCIIFNYFVRIIGENLTSVAKICALFFIFTLTITFSAITHFAFKKYSLSSSPLSDVQNNLQIKDQNISA